MDDKDQREAIRGLAEIAKAQVIYIQGLHVALSRTWDAVARLHPEAQSILSETEAWKETALFPKVDALIQNIDAIIQQYGQKQ